MSSWAWFSQKELQEEETVLDAEGGEDDDGGSRMLRDEVTPDDIASVVAAWTGKRLSSIIGVRTSY